MHQENTVRFHNTRSELVNVIPELHLFHPVINLRNYLIALAMKTIREVTKTFEDALLYLPDVVSVGIGQNGKGEPAIIVGITRHNHDAKALIPDELEGFPVILKIVEQPLPL